MKHITMIVLVAALAVSLCACGCTGPVSTTPMPSSTTQNTIMPTEPEKPTMETNIPDPSVDATMPEYNDMTTESSFSATDSTKETTPND